MGYCMIGRNLYGVGYFLIMLWKLIIYVNAHWNNGICWDLAFKSAV